MNPRLLKLLNPDGRTTEERITDELEKRRRDYERHMRACARLAAA